MRQCPRWLPAAAFGLLPALLVGAPLAVYLDGPPPAHTGGFGEPTCAQCHFDVAEPDPAGAVSLSGLPRELTPGARYLLTVTLRRAEMARGGFQLAARYADGELRGAQAGALRSVDGRVSVREHRGVAYAQHTAAGTGPSAPGVVAWQVEWTAPARPAGVVSFHLAGNAADGDESQFGDHIYAAEAALHP